MATAEEDEVPDLRLTAARPVADVGRVEEAAVVAARKRHRRSRACRARRIDGGIVRVFRPTESGSPSASTSCTTEASQASRRAVSSESAEPSSRTLLPCELSPTWTTTWYRSPPDRSLRSSASDMSAMATKASAFVGRGGSAEPLRLPIRAPGADRGPLRVRAGRARPPRARAGHEGRASRPPPSVADVRERLEVVRLSRSHRAIGTDGALELGGGHVARELEQLLLALGSATRVSARTLRTRARRERTPRGSAAARSIAARLGHARAPTRGVSAQRQASHSATVQPANPASAVELGDQLEPATGARVDVRGEGRDLVLELLVGQVRPGHVLSFDNSHVAQSSQRVGTRRRALVDRWPECSPSLAMPWARQRVVQITSARTLASEPR